jgi:hypothetical protein
LQVKLWSSRNWRCLKVCSGHEGKVMAADLCPAWTGAAAAAGDGGGDADMQEQQQQHEGGVGFGGAGEMLMGSASYDRTIKVWGPEDQMLDVLAGPSSSSGTGSDDEDDGDSEGGGNGAMELG